MKSLIYMNRASAYIEFDSVKYRNDAINDLRQALILINDPLVKSSNANSQETVRKEIQNRLISLGISP